MQVRWASTATLLAVALLAWSRADEPQPGDSQPAATVEQIERWIADLDADRFVQREDATNKLIEAGFAAVSQLRAAIPNCDLEGATRGVYVLRELAISGDEGTEAAARDALEQVALGKETSAARQAARSLAGLDKLRQKRALSELQQLGAKVEVSAQIQIGMRFVADVTSVEIGPDFRGNDADLKRLKWLGEVDRLTLEGDQISDESLAEVGGMKNLQQLVVKRAKITDAALGHVTALDKLRNIDIFYSPIGDASVEHLQKFQTAEWLKLYGTKMSKAGAAKLQTALAGVKVDHRNGAFLGVGCQAHPLGCQIVVIHPESAAERTDIRVGDVITKYEDEKVADFDALTEKIGGNVVGDTVNLTIWRQGEEMQKKIKLGEWD